MKRPSAKGYIALKILLIIFSPSSASLGFPLPLRFIHSFKLPVPHLMLSVSVRLCYISAIALGSLGGRVKGLFHRGKQRLSEVVQTERMGLLAEGVLHNEIFSSYSMAFEDNILSYIWESECNGKPTCKHLWRLKILILEC